VQIVNPRRIHRRQPLGQHVRLLLVVALKADSIARAQHRLEEIDQRFGTDQLAGGEARPGRDPLLAQSLPRIPLPHASPPDAYSDPFVFSIAPNATLCILKGV
jgi:hypothetical protein